MRRLGRLGRAALTAAAALAALAAATIGSAQAQTQIYQQTAPPPPAQTYKTVVIVGKRWMAENLNINRGNSWCYDNNNSNCDKYGRLYDWNTAKTACPKGYHLPSRQEWRSLVDYAGGDKKAGKKLKARSGWNSNDNGKDDFGFSALPGGYRTSDGSFYSAGSYGLWWTAAENGGDLAYGRGMNNGNDRVGENDGSKGLALSVRCVED
ncbi:hypothetical protein R80B4_00746 [Fibrobacteres bacterium R8-0-B4]